MPDYWISYVCPKVNKIADLVVTTEHPLTTHHVDPIRRHLAATLNADNEPGFRMPDVTPRDVFVTSIFMLHKGDESQVIFHE